MTLGYLVTKIKKKTALNHPHEIMDNHPTRPANLAI